MARYAFIDETNTVVDVITGRDEDDLPDGVASWEDYYGNQRGLTCLRTSYNTFRNQHTLGGNPFRGNYAGIGDIYDPDLDVFAQPQPFPSWTFDVDSASWVPPVALPDDGKLYFWDEDSQAWVSPQPPPE